MILSDVVCRHVQLRRAGKKEMVMHSHVLRRSAADISRQRARLVLKNFHPLQ